MKYKSIVLKEDHELEDLKLKLTSATFVSFDTETNGLDEDALVIGFSVCFDDTEAYYVILKGWDVENSILKNFVSEAKALEILNKVLDKKLIMHNAIFDCKVILKNFKIDLMPYVHTDTMVLSHLLDEERDKGLKELGSILLGEDVTSEQLEMKSSIFKNNGSLTKKNYELYKADPELIGKYGAKDSLLTYKIFWILLEDLLKQDLYDFFYEQECMPLLRGPTYDLNTIGMKVDLVKLQNLKNELEAECIELKAFIYSEIEANVKHEYPGTNKKNTFNIGSTQQLSWLLFKQLNNEFGLLTEAGKELCKKLEIPIPYSSKDKREFKEICEFSGYAKYWKFFSVDEESLETLKNKYKWVERLLEYRKNMKLIGTYVEGIQNHVRYGIIKPNFLQTGTTSGRYSGKNPNFQNLPKDDTRVKSCIIPRPGKVFVGADYSQLEPRVFSSVSQDKRLMECFEKGEDFYSVVGAPIFGVQNVSFFKDEPNSFAKIYPDLRALAKQFALATPYGTSAFQQSRKLGLPKSECQNYIDRYFSAYPKVELMMLESHEQAKRDGVVYSLYGRPRRIPEAKNITKIYGNTPHSELPYQARNLLNLSMNHRVQSSAASIMNRAAIAMHKEFKNKGIEAHIVLQVHDSVVVECYKKDAALVALIVQDCMENTTTLKGVKLEAIPTVGYSLAEL